MREKKVLITGCGGMLGNAVYPYFVDRFTDVLATDMDVNEDWLEYLDVRDHDRLEQVFDDFRPEYVLHLAAETDLEFCETNPEVAEATNATATRKIAELSSAYQSTLVYISTAGVFDGEKDGIYTERDQPIPIMVYGQTKFDGEEYVRAIAEKYYVIRAGWMVGGGSAKDHKFVKKILDQIIDGAHELHVVSDKWGTPTYTHDFALNLFALLESEQYGTYHMVCEGSGTRFDVAAEILNICGRSDITLLSVESDYFKDEYFAPRPRSEMMINENLAGLGLNRMRPWKVALSEYINLEFPQLVADGESNVISVRGYRGVDRRVGQSSYNGSVERRRAASYGGGEERRRAG